MLDKYMTEWYNGDNQISEGFIRMVIASGTLQVEKGIVNLDSFVATNEKEFIKLEKWCEKKYVSIKPAISRFALRSNATLITLDYEILGINKRDVDLTYRMALTRLNDLFGNVEELRKNDLREEITDAEVDEFFADFSNKWAK
nr:MAG TPA: hypothetical protein [Caudoviricetes sp.]